MKTSGKVGFSGNVCILPGPLLLVNTAVYCACYILTDINAVIFNNVDLKTDGLQGNSYFFLSIQ